MQKNILSQLKFDTLIHPLVCFNDSNNYFIKRDDLIPFSFGGNKVRISFEYFNDMFDKECDCIISYGNIRSNLNRVISNMSHSLSIPCFIISPNDNNESEITFNRKISELMGAKIVNCSKRDVAKTVEDTMQHCVNLGYKPYYVYGDIHGKGNEKIGVNAYFKAYQEIAKYEEENQEKFDYIFLASGTGITQAGLICGSFACEHKPEIIGISIARKQKEGKNSIDNHVEAFLSKQEMTMLSTKKYSINFIDKYINQGYGKFDLNIEQVIKNVLRFDGIHLDPIYTGKAFSGMKKYILEYGIEKSNILFLHTGGGPLFFDYINSHFMNRGI
ncbi:MAG: pyridoxal-phosphate dependent enzyme [Bacteroidales bacterium]|nr:pyridoxal-phosphate dependent enzyme [Bacteroidales bacterium]